MRGREGRVERGRRGDVTKRSTRQSPFMPQAYFAGRAPGSTRPASYRRPSPLVRPDADDLLQRRDEDLPGADVAAPVLGGGDDRVDRCLHEVVVAGDVQADLGQQIGDDQLAAVHVLALLLALVLAVAGAAGDGDAGDLG